MYNKPSAVDSGSAHLPRTAQLETLMMEKVTYVRWGTKTRRGDCDQSPHMPMTKHPNKALSSIELVDIHLIQ